MSLINIKEITQVCSKPKSYQIFSWTHYATDGKLDNITEVIDDMQSILHIGLHILDPGIDEPLLDEAYRELGYPDGRFRDALDAAMNRLASTPVPEGYVEVRRGNVLWEFRDPSLESLSSPQKHLLRMGPANARLVQSKIREIQAALGR